MEFNVKNYIATLFIFGLSIICILILIIVFQIIIAIYLKSFKTSTFLTIVFLCVIIVLYSLVSNFSRGVKLITEKEEDVVVIDGKIEKISNTTDRYSYDSKSVFASYIYLNNEKYYIMYKANLSVGDNVTIYYYPKSKVIVKIIKM